MNISKILSQKTTWAAIAGMITISLPAFGVPDRVVIGIGGVVVCLATIFQRQATQKVQDAQGES